MKTNKAYLIGRLLAVLDYVGALRDSHRTVEGQYKMAIHGPNTLMLPLQVAVTNGFSTYVHPLMTALSHADNPFGEVPLTDEEQGDFALGYFHQKADLQANLMPTPGDPRLYQEERGSRDATLTFRLTTDLKEWVKSHGGDALIRALLIAERARQESMTSGTEVKK